MAALNGGLVITLAITYLVPVASAATDRRRFAQHVASLGRTPQEVLISTWDGGSFEALEKLLSEAGSTLALLGQRHLAYPVLHYFHSHRMENAASVSVAVLDEALTLIECAVETRARLRQPVIRAARYHVDVFLATFPMNVDFRAHEVPPSPRLADIAEAGIPLTEDHEFDAALSALEEHRQRLAAIVHEDGWSWNEVVDGGPE